MPLDARWGQSNSVQYRECGGRRAPSRYDVARPMLHVNDDVVVGGEGEELDQGRVGRMRGGGFVCGGGGDLSEGGEEGEKEE
jgi:hypothetical protein